ncbi:hypothetical protein [Dysgonomonas sp. PH5-37]|uniref:hypothetical protein n=1 Tax=Dysgonomonas sp. PH5-37 TaxID=2940648 RepID=UPI002473C3CB|nr:hypothetical protein [Dysgonomonas sp. PH5-37]
MMCAAANEKRIRENPEKYYSNDIFQEPAQYSVLRQLIIDEKQKEMLAEIKRILDKYQTNYRIVVNPLFSQTKLNDKDVSYLEGVFGKENVFDFSGKNPITESKYNYYERNHFRPLVGDSIMNRIYSGKGRD